MFGFFSLYFLYSLIFVDEYERLSNQTTGWALFISSMFALISFLTAQQALKTKPKPQAAAIRDDRYFYTRDAKTVSGQRLDEQLRDSMHRLRVSEQQKRKLQEQILNSKHNNAANLS